MSIPVNARLFNKATRYFACPAAALTEVIQNAYRAGFPKIDSRVEITYDSDTSDLTVRDYGCGIANITALLTPMTSEWGEDVEASQDPAGMGVCALIAYAESITWSSKFGSLNIVSKSMTSDDDYVARVLAGEFIQPGGLSDGTCVTLHGFTGERVDELVQNACECYAEMQFFFNGRQIQRSYLFAAKEIGQVGTNRVLYRERNESQYNRRYWAMDPVAIWHGHCLKLPQKTISDWPSLVRGPYSFSSYINRVVFDIRDDSVITPKLPDRETVKMDERTTTFLQSAFSQAADFIAAECERVITARAASQSCTYTTYKTERNEFPMAQGYETQYRKRCGFEVYDTLKLRQKYNDVYGIERVCAKPGTIKEIYSESIVIIDRTGARATELAEPSCEPGGVLFGDNGEDDPLFDAGYVFSSGSDLPQLYVIANGAGKYPKVCCCVAGYELWVAAQGLDDVEQIRATGVQIDNQNQPMMITGRDPIDGGVFDDMWLFDDDCTEDSLIEAASSTYQMIFNEYQRHDDCENTADENIDAEENAWTEFQLGLDGVELVRCNVSGLKYAYGKIVTVNFTNNTITKEDGTVVKVSF